MNHLGQGQIKRGVHGPDRAPFKHPGPGHPLNLLRELLELGANWNRLELGPPGF